MVLDVNAELFEVKPGEIIALVLARSLTNSADDGYFNPKMGVRHNPP